MEINTFLIQQIQNYKYIMNLKLRFRPLTENEADIFDVGNMYRVKFNNGKRCF